MEDLRPLTDASFTIIHYESCLRYRKSGGFVMSTYMPKAGEISRKWYVIDAADKPLGRVAAAAAHILRGKHKVTFAPHADAETM